MFSNLTNCPDCGVKPGEQHHAGCDVERCANCGYQRISCDCTEEQQDAIAPELWTGEWPGKGECREYGFWCIWDHGWKEVPASTPGDQENLNRLVAECIWDKASRKFIRQT